MIVKQVVHEMRSAGQCGLVAMLLMVGCHRDISGAYLASDQTGIGWLQLVRTPDNHLTGQLSAYMLKPDGTIDQSSTAVTGAVDGENVTLTASRFLGLETVTLSGTLKGDTLTLTGSQPIPVTFKRAALSAYQAQVADLNNRSQSILKAKAVAQAQQRVFQLQANFVAQVDRIIGQMGQFDAQADVHLGRFPGAEKAFGAITTRIEQYVSRERQLAGNPNAGVTRGQISVAASQAEIQTDQMHNQIVALESSMTGNVKPLDDQATADERDCHAVAQNSGKLTQDELNNVNAACDRLETALPTFREKFGAMNGGLAHLEQVYQRENSKQQQLIQESERLE